MIAISVIIPVYNAAPWLDKCIQSILNQSMRNIEIICVDDGSTDESVHLIESIADDIVIIKNEHGGAGNARNAGLCMAKGEYIMFVDADDYLADQNALEKLYVKAQKEKIDLCGGSAQLFDGEQTISSKKYAFDAEGILNFSDYQFIYGFWRFLIKRDFLIKNGILFPAYKVFEDPVFMLDVFSRAEKFAVIPDTVYIHRRNHKSRDIDYEKALDEMKAYDDILSIAGRSGYRSIFSDIENKKRELARKIQNFYTNSFYQSERLVKVKSSFIWMAGIINENIGINEEMSFCDVGCATGMFLKYIQQKFEVQNLVGIDCNKQVLEIAAGNCPQGKFICADIGDQNFNKNLSADGKRKFDVVTFMGTLYLFEDFRIPLENVLSLLNEHGSAYIFGNFNQYGINVSYKYQYEKDGNIISCEDFSHSLDSIAKWANEHGYQIKWYEFSMPVEIEQTDNPLRVWTQTLSDGSLLQRDGLNRVKEQFLIELRRK